MILKRPCHPQSCRDSTIDVVWVAIFWNSKRCDQHDSFVINKKLTHHPVIKPRNAGNEVDFKRKIAEVDGVRGGAYALCLCIVACISDRMGCKLSTFGATSSLGVILTKIIATLRIWGVIINA